MRSFFITKNHIFVKNKIMAQVGIIMGSNSDLSVMQEAIDILKHFDIKINDF